MTTFNEANRLEISSVYATADETTALFEELKNLSAMDKNCSQFTVMEDSVITVGSAVWNRSVCAITHLQEDSAKVATWQGAVIGLIALQIIMEIIFMVRVS